MRQLKFISCLLLISISIFTCIDEIEFEEPEALKNAISIQGKLTKGDPSVLRVQINNTFDFENVQKFIDAKYVEVIDQEGHTLELKSSIQGIYELEIPANHPTFKVDYGNAFKIKLQLNNEAIYESTFDTLYAVPEPAELKVQKIQRESFNADGSIETTDLLNFNISTPLAVNNNSEKSYFLWELESVYKQSDVPATGGCVFPSCVNTGSEPKTCFLAINPVRNYRVLNGVDLSGDFVEHITLLEEIASNAIFSEGYYLTVFQQSLSKLAYEYWLTANLVVNRTGSQLEGPAGKIQTNISNITNSDDEVYGYFFVTESKTKRVYVSPDFAGNPRTICPPPLGGNAVCCNCLCQVDSSLEQPEWWVE